MKSQEKEATRWVHPRYVGKITITGKNSADAKRYQEKDVSRAIQEVESTQNDG